MDAILYPFPYRYMDYEKTLMIEEIRSVFPNHLLSIFDDRVILELKSFTDFILLKNLTYISKYEVDCNTYYTNQYFFEYEKKSEFTRQNTRYSLHGLHEYKGKYNPQIVHAVLNLANSNSDYSVFDPFCGSGTTLLECAHQGIYSEGIDINPLAVFISNVKIKSLNLDLSEVDCLVQSILSSDLIPDLSESLRIDYLKKWLPNGTLNFLEKINQVSLGYSEDVRNFILAITSNIIRDYSNQEPMDLRIRRRYSPFPDVPIETAWLEQVKKNIHKIEHMQEIGSFSSENKACLGDIRIKSMPQNQYDLAITSPPYATALPYIDTQRLSLVWLDYCLPSNIQKLESSLIGARELYVKDKEQYSYDSLLLRDDLPKSISNLISSINGSLTNSDGFRKRAVPSLLYRYFSNMKSMFENMASYLKGGSQFYLIVGSNKTRIGPGFFIDTPRLLSDIAVDVGWRLDELKVLQTYPRYGLNAKNAINDETMIVLRND